MDFNIVYCQEKTNSEWDNFVNEADGELIQTSAWADYEYKYHGWNAIRLYIKKEDTIIAGCQITIIHDDILGNYGVLRSGPCFKVKMPELMSLMVKEIKKCIQILNLSYLIVTPDRNEHDLIPFLKSENFESKFPNLPPFRIKSTYDCTLFIDLSLSLEDIFKQMKSGRKEGIKKGLKSPFEVKLGERENLKDYFNLYHFTSTRYKYVDPITQKSVNCYPTTESYDEFCKLWDALSHYGWVKLFLGTVEDEIICGSLVYTFGKTFRGKNWGWNLKYPEYHVFETSQWKIIQWAKENGFSHFDFCQIDRKIADAYKSTEPFHEELKKSDSYGMTMFKLYFGGDIIKYPGVYVFYSDKFKHLIETNRDNLTRLIKLSKDLYWAKKNFFRDSDLFSTGIEGYFN